MAEPRIDENGLPVYAPGDYDFVRVVDRSTGASRNAFAPEVTAAARAISDALGQIVADAEADIAPVIAGLGYLPPVPFAAGIAVTTSRFTVSHNGEVYAPVSWPFTTAATFDPAQWRVIQGVTGPDLAAATGAAMMGYKAAGTNTVARTVESKLGERFTPQDAGVVGDGVTDDTVAWQRYFDNCVTKKCAMICDVQVKSRITNTLNIVPPYFAASAGGNITSNISLENVTFSYAGPRDRVCINLGNGTDPIIENEVRLPSVISEGSLTWPAGLLGADTAIRIRGLCRSRVFEGYVSGFSKGIEYVGAAYNSIFGKHIINCKYGRIFTTSADETVLGFTNENVVFGGRLGHNSASNALGDAYGQVFSWDHVASYRGQNTNRFHSICFEMGSTPASYRTPVLMDGAGIDNALYDCRWEYGKGPAAICDAQNSLHASANTFDFLYLTGVGGMAAEVVQVNGAHGNILSYKRHTPAAWSSGDLSNVLSARTANSALIRSRELFHFDGTAAIRNIPSIYSPYNRRGLMLVGGNAVTGVAVDTTKIKTFRVSKGVGVSRPGRWVFYAFDAAGAPLSGTVTDSWGTESYVKGSAVGTPSMTALQSVAGRWSATTDIDSDYIITVRPEVAKLYVAVHGGTNPCVLRSIEITGYAVTTLGNATALAGLCVFSDAPDADVGLVCQIQPDSGGVHGNYTRGARVGHGAAAIGQPAGWVCTLAGWLAPAWVAATAYGTRGVLVINDSGKVYELTATGTSAGSGGPTGTSASITDGSCVWKYLGVKAAFRPEAVLA